MIVKKLGIQLLIQGENYDHSFLLESLVITSFILMILTNDSSVLLWGELGCLSPLVYKGFKMQNKELSLIIDYFLSCKLIS